MISDSATASASLSIRNHVLPPDASQTYLMLPPSWLPESTGIARVGMRCSEQQNPESGVCQQQPAVTAIHRGQAGASAENNGREHSAPARPAGAPARSAPRGRRARRNVDPRRLGPLAPQRDERRHDCWAEKQAEKPHRFQPAEQPQQDQQEGQPRGAPDQDRADEVIGDEYQHAAQHDDDDRAERVADREQVEPGEAVNDWDGKRDDGSDTGYRAGGGRVRQADGVINQAQENAFGQSDQDQPVHRAVHRRDYLARDALAALPDQAIAELTQPFGQRLAVAE